jgi:predicted transcriptional regulator
MSHFLHILHISMNSSVRKRTKAERARDMTEMLAQHLRGLSQAEIALRFGLTQPQVSRDLKQAQKEMRETADVDTRARFQEKLVELRDVKKEYWTAWERSKSDREVQVSKKVEAEGHAGKGTECLPKSGEGASTGRREAGLRVENRDGDPRFLEGVTKCIQTECKLLGLDEEEYRKLNGDKNLRQIQFIEIHAAPPRNATSMTDQHDQQPLNVSPLALPQECPQTALQIEAPKADK